MAARLDGFQRRHPSAGFPIAVVYKFLDDQGSYLAALITYYAFVSLFPLLLLLTTVLGIVLAGDPHAQQQVLNSAVHQIPLIGEQLQDPKRIGGGVTGIVVGVLGAVYGGLGVGQAAQNAMNNAWAVPRNERGNPLAVRGRSALLLVTVGLGVIATSALVALGTGAGGAGVILKPLFTVLSVVGNAALFIFAFRLATARPLTVRQVAPGAVIAALVWFVLQHFGAVYITHIQHASNTNAVFAVVLGLLAFFYLASVVLVFCVELNVVREERLYPRALLTPFTDSVELTGGDRRAYTGRAQAQRAKGFQDIDVSYGPSPLEERRDEVQREDDARPLEPVGKLKDRPGTVRHPR